MDSFSVRLPETGPSPFQKAGLSRYDTRPGRNFTGVPTCSLREAHTMFFTEVAQIISLAAAAQLPAIHGYREHVQRGGLVSYGIDVPQNFRRTGYFVDRILKGIKPGDLPIELPTKLELAINVKAAKALNLEIPSKFLFTADEVIE
jgi:ABC-type uncharacterized transport system substrate-binding protein